MGPDRYYLLAFVTTSCRECAPVWEMLAAVAASGEAPGPAGYDTLVIVTPSRSMEHERRALQLAPPGVAVHMASEAWFAYGVTQAGTFMLVRGPSAAPPLVTEDPGSVLGAGVPADVSELRRLIGQWRAAALAP